MKHLIRILALLLLCALTALPILAATPGDYGYYDANGDGEITVVDVLTILRAILNDSETDSNLLQVLRTAKTTTTSEPVEVMMVSVDEETETVTLSGEHLESFTVPFATLGLTKDTDFDALIGEEVTMTVPRPAETFFENYDPDKILAGRPQPLIPQPEDPDTPAAPAVTDVTFAASNAYLKFTITPPADETGIAKYEVRVFEEGNDAGRIGWPVNAQYCEYIGLERFKPEVNYDTFTVYAYDADGNVLSEYTEAISITHTDASVTPIGAYVEPLSNYGGLFFAEPLDSSYALTLYDADGNKLGWNIWLDANSTVSDLYEHSGNHLSDVAEVEIASSRSVVVSEANGVNTLAITEVGMERTALTPYPAEYRLGSASNLHIDAWNCLAWDVPAYDFAVYSELWLHETDGAWVYIGMIGDGMYSVNSLPDGEYDKVRIYTTPAWDVQAYYGFGTFERNFPISVSGVGDTFPAVTNVRFDAPYSNLYIDFDEPAFPASPVYQLYLHNGNEWVGPLATSYGDSFSLRNAEVAPGHYSKIKIVSTDEWSDYKDGVFETDCSLTVTETVAENVTMNAYALGDGEYAFCFTGFAADANVNMYVAKTPSMSAWRTAFSLDQDQTGAGARICSADPDAYYRAVSFDEATVTDTLTASYAYTVYRDWGKFDFAAPVTDNTILSETSFREVNTVPAFAFTPAEEGVWQEFAVHFSKDGGETWVGMNIRWSTSVALSNREWLEIEETTTYNKVRVIRFANGAAEQYIADCSFTVTAAGTATLPAPVVEFDEDYQEYVLVYKNACPAGAGYIYALLSKNHGSSWGSSTYPSDEPSDILICAYPELPEDYANYTVRVRFVQDIVTNGMTATANIYDTGTLPVVLN